MQDCFSKKEIKNFEKIPDLKKQSWLNARILAKKQIKKCLAKKISLNEIEI
jgi:hypothetical protein